MQRKTFLVLTILLLLALLISSCSIRQTGGSQTASKFANEIIYSASDGIRAVNFDGLDDKLLVLKSDVLKLYDKKGEFDEVTLIKVGISSDMSKLFFVAFFSRKPPQGQVGEIIRHVLFSVDTNGRKLKQLTQEDVDCYEEHLSPDTKLLAFMGISLIKESGNNKGISTQKEAIYILWMADGSVKRATPWYYDTGDSNGLTFAGITDLTFSKDGKSIFFAARSKNGNNYDLNMLDVEKGDLKTIVSGVIDITIHDWSPDGKILAFTVEISGNQLYRKEKLCAVKSDGSGFEELTKEFYYIYLLKWSSDSSKILFHHLGKPVTRTQSPKNDFLSVVESNGTDFKEIGGYDTIEGYWAPDGKKIVAVIGQDINFALEETTGKQAVYAMDVESINPLRITPYYTSIDKLIFHPSDSNKIIFAEGTFPYLNTLRILNLDNRNIQAIKSFEENQDITDIVFSPDHKRYFIRVLKTTFDTALLLCNLQSFSADYNMEQNASLYVYVANTNALIDKFEDNNEYLTNIEWIDNQKVCFIKGIVKPGVTEGNLGKLCILDVDSGKTVELTQANIDLSSYGWWLAIN